MEVQGTRRRRDVSPDRARVCIQPKMKMFRKVQVVYYLCRNGHLEHPHFMEVSHLSGQQLRLKDVIDRLSVLRGRGMPSLFSWSCKRSYKNGYVWKDLAENDVIYPAEGSEYVLKGSELIEGCAERFQQLHENNRHPNAEPIYHSKRIQLPASLRREIEEDDEEMNQEEDERLRSSSHGHQHDPRRSQGVSTDIIEVREAQNQKGHHAHHPTELTLDDSGSPPSSSSTPSDKAQTQPAPLGGGSQRFDDPAPEPAAARGSVLLNLFACGTGSARRNPSPSQGPVVVVATRPGQGPAVGGGSGRRSGGSLLQQGVLRRAARAVEDEEISCMSENPRFGNLQAEEKEYFSGSIVESACEDRVEPGLKKSASYNEERSKTSGLASSAVEDEAKNFDNGCSSLKGKCIPRKRHTKHQLKK